MPLQQQIIAAAKANNIAELQQLERESSAVERQEAIAADNFSLFQHAVFNDYTAIVMWAWHQASYGQQRQLQQLPCFNNINDELKQQLLANAHQMPKVMDDDNDYLSKIPNEVIARIYSFVPANQRLKASVVNRHIHDVVVSSMELHLMADKISYIDKIFQPHGLLLERALKADNKTLILRLSRLAELFDRYWHYQRDCNIGPWLHQILKNIKEFILEHGINKLIDNAILWQPSEENSLADHSDDEHFVTYFSAALAVNNADLLNALKADFNIKFPSLYDARLHLVMSLVSERDDIFKLITLIPDIQANSADVPDIESRRLGRDRKIHSKDAFLDAAATSNMSIEKIMALLSPHFPEITYNKNHFIAIAAARAGNAHRLQVMLERHNYNHQIVSDYLSHALRHYQLECLEIILPYINETTNTSDAFPLSRIKNLVVDNQLELLTWLYQHNIQIYSGIIDYRNVCDLKLHLSSSYHFRRYFELAQEKGCEDIMDWLIQIAGESIKHEVLKHYVLKAVYTAVEIGDLSMLKRNHQRYVMAGVEFDLKYILEQGLTYGHRDIVIWCYSIATSEQRKNFIKIVSISANVDYDTKAELEKLPPNKEAEAMATAQKEKAEAIAAAEREKAEAIAAAEREKAEAERLLAATIKEQDFSDCSEQSVANHLVDDNESPFNKMIKQPKFHSQIAEDIAKKLIASAKIEFIYMAFELVGIGKYDQKNCGIEGSNVQLSLLRRRTVGLGLLSKWIYRETDDSEVIARAGIDRARELLEAEKQPLSQELKKLYLSVVDRQIVRKETKEEKQARAGRIDEFQVLINALEPKADQEQQQQQKPAIPPIL